MNVPKKSQFKSSVGWMLLNNLHVSVCDLCLQLFAVRLMTLHAVCFLSRVSCRQKLTPWHNVLLFPLSWSSVFCETLICCHCLVWKTEDKRESVCHLPFHKWFVLFFNLFEQLNLYFLWYPSPLCVYRHLCNFLKDVIRYITKNASGGKILYF